MLAEYHLCTIIKYDTSSVHWQKSSCYIYCNINLDLYISVRCSELDNQKYEQLNVSQIWQKYFEEKKTY